MPVFKPTSFSDFSIPNSKISSGLEWLASGYELEDLIRNLISIYRSYIERAAKIWEHKASLLNTGYKGCGTGKEKRFPPFSWRPTDRGPLPKVLKDMWWGQI